MVAAKDAPAAVSDGEEFDAAEIDEDAPISLG
jgi:hypothetical protein